MEDFLFSPYSCSSSFPRRRSVSASPYFSHPHPHRPLSYANFQERYPANYPERYPANYQERYPANYPERYVENYPERYVENYPERHLARAPARTRLVSIPVSDNLENLKILEEEKKRRQREREEEAAARIQRVVRGFMVRKNMGIVRRIEGEVEEIAKRIGVEEERIMREEKEWIRVNEMLMGLLFRLDEVRGVREYRRKVIRRVIGLQERLDSILTSSSGDVLEGNASRTEGDFVEKSNSDVVLDGSVQSTVEDFCGGKNVDGKKTVGEGNSDDILNENEVDKLSEGLRIEEDYMEQGDSNAVLDESGALDGPVQLMVEDFCEGKNCEADNSVEEGSSGVVLEENGDVDEVKMEVEESSRKKNADAENFVEERDSDLDETAVVKETLNAEVEEIRDGGNADAEDSVSNAVVGECEGNKDKLAPEDEDAGESEVQNVIGEQHMEEDHDSSLSDAMDKSVEGEINNNEQNPVAECPEEVAVDSKEKQVAEVVESGAMDSEATRCTVPVAVEALDEGNCTVDTATLMMADAGETSNCNSEMKNVLEKVMAESERLQKLVAALCEQSAEQCSLMAGLMERVGHLEQVVLKMDKKKKKRLANNVLSSPNDKICSQKKR